ncbi:MAG: tRNA epoxyqueuosine(34) reductase QueG [Pseudomonadales bacterium]|nr:tRNA epoxyqueuosine(34) reductase QueG [Pseudomonadales bacterium]
MDARAEDLGFQKLAITDIDLSEHGPHVRRWLDKGFAGEMGYLHRNLEKRLNPDQLEPGTYRVITARMNYLPADTQPIEILENPNKGYISRYALGRDYHKVLRRRLATLAGEINALLVQEQPANYQFRAFTDSAPVLEKALAEKGGLGWMGKHTLILDKEAGSWFFLGEIYTNAPLTVDSVIVADACGKCSACMTVCPTQAIISAKKLDATRCISYLTIEHKESIDETLRPLMGNRIYGCDDCQLFCPWNREAPTTTESDFAVRNGLDQPELLDLFALSEDEFRKLIQGSAMGRISYPQWQRNIAIALGNGSGGKEVVKALTDALGKVNPMVDEHIRWALEQLQIQSIGTPAD